mmetsp:Transcript_791/g.1603  ORF Transcript_791/g.1603 Transcript_791/m.1603 type:complete len:108 (-) Transcript_791:5894-6217(-)
MIHFFTTLFLTVVLVPESIPPNKPLFLDASGAGVATVLVGWAEEAAGPLLTTVVLVVEPFLPLVTTVVVMLVPAGFMGEVLVVGGRAGRAAGRPVVAGGPAGLLGSG